jgi:hypothetical protein
MTAGTVILPFRTTILTYFLIFYRTDPATSQERENKIINDRDRELRENAFRTQYCYREGQAVCS